MSEYFAIVLTWRRLWLSMAISLFLIGFSAPNAPARSPDLDPQLTGLCHNAIALASQRSGVPHEVMLAISLTETGKNIGGVLNPWPWTVNMEGAGVWFETKPEALAYVNAHFARGARSFDVGCFQINYKWHHQHFSSIEDMFDPVINATYAARYLTELYHETGTWAQAAGFYHSRTPEYSQRYAKRFARHLEKIRGQGGGPVFEGHGSETLRIAQAQPKPPRAVPVWPLANLGALASTEIISSKPSGSLVRLDGGPGLLTASGQPMF